MNPALTNFQLSMCAGAATFALSAASVYYATYAVRSQWLGETIWRGRTDTSAVALTFDDGPTEETERVLDVLGRDKLRATFFMIGQSVERRPQTARRIIAEGHEIGNHSYSHPIYLYQRARATARELERAQSIIAQATGVTPQWSRPPCGVRSRAYFAAARRLNLRTVQWTVAGFDWKKLSAMEIARHVLSQARAGSIILLHDGDSEGLRNRRETIKALPIIIEGLREKKLRIAPLSQLLAGENAPANSLNLENN